MSTNSNGSRAVIKASKTSMTDIAAALRRKAGRPVGDHTDLKGSFDFQIEWAPEETPDSVDPSLNTVLKEQLGLKLQSAKGAIEIFVIDEIAHPPPTDPRPREARIFLRAIRLTGHDVAFTGRDPLG